MKQIFKNKEFLRDMLAIAIPIALQNLITSSLNMVDTLMISQLGKSSIAAVGLANQLFFFYSLIIFGINSGSSIFISQFWGKKDIENIKRILGLAVSLSTLAGLVFTIVAFFSPEMIMKFFIDDEIVIRLGSDYLRIVSLSYIITGIGFAFSIASRSIGEPKMPMVVSAISFITNTIFNYLLIFGHFGFPELGVKGAAYGTLIARIVEISFIFYFIYKNIKPLAASLRELTDWKKEFINRYLKTTYPVIINEAFWALGQVMYSAAYAKMGAEATAAVQVSGTIQNIFFVMVRGLGNACTVMVGNKIGARDEEQAYDYAIQFLIMSTIAGLILGAILSLTPDITLKLFKNLEPDVYNLSRKLLFFSGLFYFIRTFNSTLIVGVLRGGGDTTFSMYLEMGSVWLVGVPLAFVGVLIFRLPVYIVFILVSVEEIVKAVIGLPRVKSKKWIRNVT
ncbi:putative efflux protein, MATE family [Tissierella praeacuta DSM 18095]|uniref:Putative efflux protein, MATE family n=1 Tax=Tissierella praeacuta DSM 18095 TaxID=1123404 RepID=A0A1M4YT83_9FIRM|nr:MATE family efflux transporter [Tissierella praeacuta]TCU71558.1 putative MATE family efflux protein [Tissierella praeacuta]SHF09034.1 putative efflux protein, MATE family [Tissierella praeacuta DSM 18095]SUP00798.1 Multidrug-efflux transporter [Tissierella praeacuta]